MINTMLSEEAFTAHHQDYPSRNRKVFQDQSNARKALTEYAYQYLLVSLLYVYCMSNVYYIRVYLLRV